MDGDTISLAQIGNWLPSVRSPQCSSPSERVFSGNASKQCLLAGEYAAEEINEGADPGVLDQVGVCEKPNAPNGLGRYWNRTYSSR